MKVVRPCGRGWTRRAFLGCFSLIRLPAASPKGTVFPSEVSRYLDPLTEFEVRRLTDPGCSSHLPVYYCRFMSRRRDFLLYASDRTGSPQAFRMDLRTGRSRQLTDAAELDISSLVLLPDDRSFAYFDGRLLRQASLRNLRGSRLYEIAKGYEGGEGLSITSNGVHAVLVERGPGSWRIRLVDIRRRKASTVIETENVIRHPVPQPGRPAALYRGAGDTLWLVSYNGRQHRRLELAPGGLGPAIWSPDGRAVLYLNYPADQGELNNLREFRPDTGEDGVLAPTTQFVHFGVSGNASVFVGASGSKASPYVLLLLRAVGRELALCEHRASDPAQVAPVFAPDSRSIYFHSDKDGKQAVYSVLVNKFVEATGA